MFWFANYYNENRENKILKISLLLILIGFICMIFSINIYTIVFYNIVYYIFVIILLNITETRLFNYSNENVYKDQFNTEYFIFREIYLNVARILGFSILWVVGTTQNMSWLKMLLLFITVALIYMIKMSRDLNKDEEKKES